MKAMPELNNRKTPLRQRNLAVVRCSACEDPTRVNKSRGGCVTQVVLVKTSWMG